MCVRPDGFKGDIRCSLSGHKRGFTAFLGMNGREEKLENGLVPPCGTSSLGLYAAHYPVTAGFGFLEGVETTGHTFNQMVVKNNLDAGGGLATATMHQFRSQALLEAEVHFVQNRVNVVVHS